MEMLLKIAEDITFRKLNSLSFTMTKNSHISNFRMLPHFKNCDSKSNLKLNTF